MDFKSLVDLIRCKMQARKRVGFFDYHPLSFDQRIARARAERLWQRIKYGKRMTINQALYH